MALVRSSLFILFLIRSLNAMTELQTKQSPANLRFISPDGKYTYYQRSIGTLHLSTNYSVKTILTGMEHTNYTIQSLGSVLAISQDEYFHQNIAQIKTSKIFTSTFGKEKALLISEGSNPKLHLDGRWLSIFHPLEREVSLHLIEHPEVVFRFALSKTTSALFIPEVEMISEDTIFYTDILADGKQIILKINRNNSELSQIIKADYINQTFELCKKNSLVVVASHPIFENESKESSIFSLDKEGGQRQELYSSKTFDLGHMICNFNDNLYFIKDSNAAPASSLHDLAELNMKTKSISILSNSGDLLNILQFGPHIITAKDGKYFILAGENLTGSQDLMFGAQTP